MPEWTTREPEREDVGTCAACGEPIYAGEAIRRDEGHMIHNNKTCLTEWVKANWDIREVCEACGIEEEIAG